MRHINGVYTQRFNRKHGCDGQLFRGKYKSILEVSRYIHLNPVRIKALKEKDAKEKRAALMSYEASSLSGFFFKKKRQDFVHYGFVLDYMGGDNAQGRKRYRAFVAKRL